MEREGRYQHGVARRDCAEAGPMGEVERGSGTDGILGVHKVLGLLGERVLEMPGGTRAQRTQSDRWLVLQVSRGRPRHRRTCTDPGKRASQDGQPGYDQRRPQQHWKGSRTHLDLDAM